MTNGGRIATAQGAMLADPTVLGNAFKDAGARIFEPQFWAARSALQSTPGGRGSSWFVGGAESPWVLRHYRRGGLVARLLTDRYLFIAERRVRAFAEWHLLCELWREGLPVPQPVAAAYARGVLTYRCDLLTVRINNVATLASRLRDKRMPDALWRHVGAVIARFHRAGVDHADLNAHNVLCGEDDAAVHLIDFDRGRRRDAGGPWQMANLKRLRRSLYKVAPDFAERDWVLLMEGYA
jgi:3-deoxy-D-manno-octulosonic acid kinase